MRGGDIALLRGGRACLPRHGGPSPPEAVDIADATPARFRRLPGGTANPSDTWQKVNNRAGNTQEVVNKEYVISKQQVQVGKKIWIRASLIGLQSHLPENASQARKRVRNVKSKALASRISISTAQRWLYSFKMS